MLHHLPAATFELPAQLKDNTVHMFAPRADGPAQFNVVMSHMELQSHDTLADVADDLLSGLPRTLPGYSLLHSTDRTLDGAPAVELTYRWRSGMTWLQQRQVVTLVAGAGPGEVQALLIAATCPETAGDKWSATFDDLLNSLKLRGRPESSAPAPSVTPAINTATVFALCPGRRSLHAFADQEEACRATDVYEVEQAAWRFFDAAGQPLHARFAVAGAWWRKPGKYVLETRPGHAAPLLHNELHRATTFVCASPAVGLSSLAEVRTALGHSTEG